ncbi:MAG: phosphoethanolamine transferase [Candidatus Thiodiazotropha taylori]|nr:phosphoethanolamine transferase [Candidatus Thiodiazotropha taylori]
MRRANTIQTSALISLIIILAAPNLYTLQSSSIDVWKKLAVLSLFFLIVCIPFLVLNTKNVLFALSPFVLLVPIELVHDFYYGGRLSTGAIGSLFETNIHEAKEFFTDRAPIVLLSVLLVIVYFLLLTTLILQTNLNKRLLSLLIAVAMLNIISANVYKIISANPSSKYKFHDVVLSAKDLLKNTFPTSSVISFYRYIVEYNRLLNSISEKEGFKFNSIQNPLFIDKDEVYILVLGESSRRKNWSLYGYERNTTPSLSSRNDLIVYDDFISTSTITRTSVPLILTRATPLEIDIAYAEKSLISTFKESGFETFWISNQEKYGKHDTASSIIAGEADHHAFISLSIEQAKLDEELLQQIKNALRGRDNKKLIIVHTIGSHYAYKNRYSTRYNIFKTDVFDSELSNEENRIINEYDNSIAYTDYFLNEVIDLLMRDGSQSGLFYLSDHGQVLFDNDKRTNGHGYPAPDRNEVEVPFLVWLSSEYIRNNPSKYEMVVNNKSQKVSSDSIFHSFTDMANIEFDDLNYELSIFQESFKNDARRLLTPDNNPLEYRTLK